MSTPPSLFVVVDPGLPPDALAVIALPDGSRRITVAPNVAPSLLDVLGKSEREAVVRTLEEEG